ncbi:hypothetical protein AVEN_33998-1 [Araneus ventricosus]|uniref:Uncharacterized protein n=1 Tax=Araneus ventricosus TaxID=182803 RepID=A0A4Y2E6X0_ARAVE|nr:hypothetical protein AVEN_33998-1 [Araneus ventricosus]
MSDCRVTRGRCLVEFERIVVGKGKVNIVLFLEAQKSVKEVKSDKCFILDIVIDLQISYYDIALERFTSENSKCRRKSRRGGVM